MGWSLVSLPSLALITYRLWDHYVGPDTFSFWRFRLAPPNMSLLLTLAVVAPLLLLASEGKDLSRSRDGSVSAFSCFALAAAMTAILCDHFFPLAGAFVAATLFMAIGVLLGKTGTRRFPPIALIPMAISDLCLALGILLMYLSEPSRGLLFPAVALNPKGKLAASCGLMLAAALIRLGTFPFHRWMAAVSKGGKEIRLVHILAVNLALATYLLYMVTQVFFHWGGNWVWICLGVGVLTLVVVLRDLLASSERLRVWGLLCAAVGAHLMLAASPGSQMSAATMRFGLFVGMAGLGLIHLGSDAGAVNTWARVAGGVDLLGLPPLAGFVWRWMEFQVLVVAFGSGSSVLFIAALPLILAGALIEGFVPLLMPMGQSEGSPKIPALASSVLLVVLLVALGLYSGSFVDLVMRAYGLSVNLPFSGWTSLAWAILICIALAVFLPYAWGPRRGEEAVGSGLALPSLPLMPAHRHLSLPWIETRRARLVSILCLALLYAAWVAAMIYLGLK